MNKVTGGSVGGGGDIDMRGHTIIFLGLDNTDHAVARVSELKQKLDKNGNDQMNGNLNMNNFKIKNLKTQDKDAVNKKNFQDELSKSHLISSHKKNAFKYLIDTNESSSEYNIIVVGVVDFISRNKKSYEITLQKDAGTNNFRSRIGFNLYPQDIGQFTLIFEFYPPEMTNVQLSCQATTAWVKKQVQKDSQNYSKILVQINNGSKDTPDYIFFTMHGTATANTCASVSSVLRYERLV